MIISELEKVRKNGMSCSTIVVNPVPPFRLDLTVWALRRRAENIIDRWDGRTYSRMLVLGRKPVELNVTQIGTRTSPRLRVIATGPRLTRPETRDVSALVERMLGTRVDLTRFYRLAARHPELGDLVRRFRGLKPPRFPTVFESLLNAFACQQLSLALGVLLLNRLAERYGVAIENKSTDGHTHFHDPKISRPCILRQLGSLDSADRKPARSLN